MTSHGSPTSGSLDAMGLTAGPLKFKLQVAAFDPPQFLKSLPEAPQLGLTLWIICIKRHQHADPPHAVTLLRARRERPRDRTAEQRDELAPF